MSEDALDTRSAFERWEGQDAVPAGESDEAIRQRIRQAYEEARKEGYAAGKEQARSEMEQEVHHLRQLAGSLGNSVDSLDFWLADEILSLALDVAKQVIAGELAARPERILDVVKLVLQQVAESTHDARLLLNPEDAKLVRPILNDLLDKSRLRIVEDARILRGGCRVETAQGDLDATLQMRWRQVISVLGANKNWLE
jgi:flagellar assembly protein FliH